MPRLSVWTIRSSLIYLTLGFTFGGILLFNKGITLSPQVWLLLPAHIEFLLLGWMVQLVMGVAFWILPRFKRPPKRGNENLAWLAFILLNLGIWVDGIGPLVSSSPWLPASGKAAEFLAALAFALYAWPRVKPSGV